MDKQLTLWLVIAVYGVFMLAVGILSSIAFDNVCPNYNVQYMSAIRSKLWFLPGNRQFRKNREES